MKIRWFDGKSEADDCFFVRKKVFVFEQGFSEKNEFDEIDDTALHLCIYENGKPIAAARLFGEGKAYHCGRICVLFEYRKSGVGRIIMKELEKKAKEKGSEVLELGAQLTAVEFYKNVGFEPFGGEFLDENCPHIMMKKNI